MSSTSVVLRSRNFINYIYDTYTKASSGASFAWTLIIVMMNVARGTNLPL